MTFPMLNSTLASSNLMYFFVYANTVTNQLFGFFITVGFFLVVLLGSSMAQLKMRGDINIKHSLLASSFATLGWATIIEMYSGILSSLYFYFIVGITVFSVIWTATGD